VVSLKNLIEELNNFSDGYSGRKERELFVCYKMLTDEELQEISSLSTGYSMARDRVIENIIKLKYPEWYREIVDSERKVPIFNIGELIIEFEAETQD